MNKSSIITRWVPAAVCVLLTVLTLSGCDFGLFSSRSVDNPKQAVIGFIDALQADRFDRTAADTAMSYVANYSTMGFEKYTEVNDDPLEETLFELLRSSYSVEFDEKSLEPVTNPYQGRDMTVSGKQAFVRLSFESLDLSVMSEKLAEAVTETGAERMYDGETFETEEEAAALVEEVFAQIFDDETDVSDYCVEHRLTLELAYVDSRWKIVVSDEFYDALLGRNS